MLAGKRRQRRGESEVGSAGEKLNWVEAVGWPCRSEACDTGMRGRTEAWMLGMWGRESGMLVGPPGTWTVRREAATVGVLPRRGEEAQEGSLGRNTQ